MTVGMAFSACSVTEIMKGCNLFGPAINVISLGDFAEFHDYTCWIGGSTVGDCCSKRETRIGDTEE